MLNVIRIMNNDISEGFVMRSSNYLFTHDSYEILSETQVNVPTNLGIILLDLSVTIENQSFQSINDFCNYLYNI